MAKRNLEERVAILEAEIRRLKRLVGRKETGCGWKKMIGAFANDPYYEEAMRYGRKYRESLRPKQKKTK